jgi:predicted dehydrogenase
MSKGTKIRWGVISTANIGVARVLPAMQQGEFCSINAIASRSLEKAQQAAARLDIPKAYGSYEELLADPDIDAIYNPTPNHLHVPWTIKALQAGKHVLCEKPIALSATEAQQLANAAQQYPHLKLMEAFMYRHHPQWSQVKQIVTSGGIGELRTIQSMLCYFNDNPDNVRNQADIGGGGLLDIGCYNISISRFIFGEEPRRAIGIVDIDPAFRTDRLVSGILDFGRGTSNFTCSTQMVPCQRVYVYGTTGRIEVEIALSVPTDRPARIWHEHDGVVEEIQFELCNHYTLQGDRFSLAILNDTPVPTPVDDAVANMRVIDAVFQSAKSGEWVYIPQ